MIFYCHAQSIKVSMFTNVQLKNRLPWLRRVRHGARQFHLVENRIRVVCFNASPHQLQKYVQMVFHVFNSGTKLVHLRFARRVPCCFRDRTFRASGTAVCKLRNCLFPAFLTILHVPFSVGIEKKRYSSVADFCSNGNVAVTKADDCLAAFSKVGQSGSNASAFPLNVKVPVIKVFATSEQLWLPSYPLRDFDTVCPIVLTAFVSPVTLRALQHSRTAVVLFPSVP